MHDNRGPRPPSVRGVVNGGLSYADRCDTAVSARLQRVDHAGLDTAMRRLSAAADHSKLWAGIAGGLWLTGRPGPRAGALAGLGSGALASLLVNQGAKRLLPRQRPAAEVVALRRRLRRVPTSSSFPSGHAASAAAFTTGVALRSPVSAVPLVPLAAAVAFSRVHTGVHFFSDVVVGAAVGAGVGVAVGAGPGTTLVEGLRRVLGPGAG